jgi:DNA-binding transcriptional MerR regulator
MATREESERDRFRIGTVSRLTGLSAHTLRKWEARYGAVTPRRGERGQRYYSQDDVERLLLIKRLVEAGAAPRDVGGLVITELKQEAAQLNAAKSVAEKSQPGRLSWEAG